MNTPYQPDYSARLAELTAYAEKYDNLNSAIDEADQAIAAAQEAMENLFAVCEEARDAAAEDNEGASSELDELCSLIDSAQSDLENVSVPDNFRRRAASLRHTMERQGAASAAANEE